jgi:hypothetical protein
VEKRSEQALAGQEEAGATTAMEGERVPASTGRIWAAAMRRKKAAVELLEYWMVESSARPHHIDHFFFLR